MSTKIDFSKMERLTPRADSWDKVCARLDAEKAKGKIVSIKSWYSAIPLAASFVLVSLTAVLPSFTMTLNRKILFRPSMCRSTNPHRPKF